MKSRRKAREAALQALYQCDTTADFSASAVALFFEVFYPEQLLASQDGENDETAHEPPPIDEHRHFSRELVLGVIANLKEIDSRIGAASTHWSLGRMSRVDRNILRLATYEIMFRADIPLSVTINEAIEIAKRFGAEDSPMFVNGVLDHIAKMLEHQLRAMDKNRSQARKTGT